MGFDNNLLNDIYLIVKNFSTHINEVENVLNFNRIWKQRLVDVGVISSFAAINWGFLE